MPARANEHVRPCALLAVLLLGLAPPLLAQQGRVTYLANEGVLVERRGTRVLVDALFRDSLEPYARHAPDVQEALETGRKPFDRVGLALATHFHLDHWDAGAISRFLRRNPQARFASTEHATAMLPSALRDRVLDLWPASGRPSTTLDLGAAKVTAIPLEHGATQNLAYLLEVSGKTVAHLGDADTSVENFAKLKSAGAVDLALVPFWWLLDPAARSFVRGEWKPRDLGALHIGTTDLDSIPALQAAWPGLWAPTRPRESRTF